MTRTAVPRARSHTTGAAAGQASRATGQPVSKPRGPASCPGPDPHVIGEGCPHRSSPPRPLRALLARKRATRPTQLQRGPAGSRERRLLCTNEPWNQVPDAPGSTRCSPYPKIAPPSPRGASGALQDFAGDMSTLEARPVGHVPWPRLSTSTN
ncbi:hypothetical protein NDU88_001579 [Pleurodeles waltl]|uniref:Uncharacterized protein n=1 Tax=Pleurodeles waltl TaxID=8319 RepID=A0AAV7NB72_PLEWA|nr:hypothetical protein NDU88_001579 [Pleurodeles waltl]